MRLLGVEIVGAIGRRPERRAWQVKGVSTDSRTIRPGEIFFALKGARCDGHDFVTAVLERGAAAAVVDRPVTVPRELRDRVVRVRNTLAALGGAARAHRRRWGGMVIAITGSNGKTTTREMMFHLLSEQIGCKRSPRSFNTDVGVPLTLFQAGPDDKAMIVEMGTNAPGEIAALAGMAEPNVAVLTNIAETHLEGLGTVEGVAEEKGHLLAAVRRGGTAFLNADDPWLSRLGARRGRKISFGLGQDAMFRGRDLEGFEDGYAFRIPGGFRVRLRAPGRHNVSNALAALAVAGHLGLDLRAAAARLESFRLPEMRCQVERIGHVTVVSDCYNANPGSMRAALKTLRETFPLQRRVAVLGEMMELGAESDRLHAGLGAEAARSGVDALWAVGRHGESVASSARASGMAGHVSHADELDRVAEAVCDFLRPGDVVLVKGSRGMRMERLVERFRGAASAPPSSGPSS